MSSISRADDCKDRVTASPRVMPSAHMSPREAVWLAEMHKPCAEGSPEVLMGNGSARLLQ